MWPRRSQASASATDDPARLTLQELIATDPRHVRGHLAPGTRFPTGMRPGQKRAHGSDLDSIGPYAPGDDIRWMDWRATARTGRAQMKRFVAESHLARMLVVDLRPHLLFGTAKRPMAKTGALLAAYMAWEAFILQEPVGLVTLPGIAEVRPRRGRGHVLHLLKTLTEEYERAMQLGEDAGPEEIAAALDVASGHLSFNDEICLFSDFGELPADVNEKVRELSSIRRFRAVIVEDGMYHHSFSGGRFPYQAVNEQERSLAAIDANSSHERHQDAVEALRSDLRRTLSRSGWRVTEATSSATLSPGMPR